HRRAPRAPSGNVRSNTSSAANHAVTRSASGSWTIRLAIVRAAACRLTPPGRPPTPRCNPTTADCATSATSDTGASGTGPSGTATSGTGDPTGLPGRLPRGDLQLPATP